MAPLWMRFRTFFSLALAFSGLGIIAACVGDEPPITPAPDASTPDGGDGSCSDTIQSNANCGACGHACAAGENCYAGVCKGKDPVEVGAGWRSACAVLRSVEVWCWGLNDQFQLGVDANGDSKCLSRTRDPVACRPTPVRVAGLTNVRHVSVGMNSACALRDDGSVWCWGGNEKGQLGHPNQGDAT
jgi:hypothetical protein